MIKSEMTEIEFFTYTTESVATVYIHVFVVFLN